MQEELQGYRAFGCSLPVPSLHMWHSITPPIATCLVNVNLMYLVLKLISGQYASVNYNSCWAKESIGTQKQQETKVCQKLIQICFSFCRIWRLVCCLQPAHWPFGDDEEKHLPCCNSGFPWLERRPVAKGPGVQGRLSWARWHMACFLSPLTSFPLSPSQNSWAGGSQLDISNYSTIWKQGFHQLPIYHHQGKSGSAPNPALSSLSWPLCSAV